MNEPSPRSPRYAPGQLFRFSSYFYLFLAIAGLIWIGLQNGAISAALFIDATTWWRDLVAGFGVGGALLSMWAASRRFVAAARQLEAQIAELLGPIDRFEAVALAVLSGVAEEIFFRGAVQRAWGWLVAAALFAVLHTGPGRALKMWTLFAALAGLALGAVTLWTGNLTAAITAHFAVNAVGLARVGRQATDRARATEPPGA